MFTAAAAEFSKAHEVTKFLIKALKNLFRAFLEIYPPVGSSGVCLGMSGVCLGMSGVCLGMSVDGPTHPNSRYSASVNVGSSQTSSSAKAGFAIAKSRTPKASADSFLFISFSFLVICTSKLRTVSILRVDTNLIQLKNVGSLLRIGH
jgi:hypothetical protein